MREYELEGATSGGCDWGWPLQQANDFFLMSQDGDTATLQKHL